MQSSSRTGQITQRYTNWIAAGLLLAGLGLLVYSQFFCGNPDFYLFLPGLVAARAAGLALLAAGLCLLFEGGRLPWFRRDKPDLPAAAVELPIGRARAAAVILALLLAAAASALAGTGWKAHWPFWSALAWLAGIAYMAWAGWQGPFTRARAPRWFWLAGLAVAAAALLLRAVSLQSVPIIFTGDESGFGKVAVQILNGDNTNLFTAPYMGGTNLPFLYDLIQAGALVLFGRTAWAFRATSALAGTLTVLALFYLGLRWFGRRTALFSALILAGNHLHLHFSRYAISNVFDGLFFVLVIGLLWDAWMSGERKKYLLAGLALGFSQYFYTSARALPVAALAFFAAAFLFDRPRARKALPSIAFFWAAFLVVFLPMILYYLGDPHMFTAPWSRVGQESVQAGGLLGAFRPAQLPATLRQIALGLLGFTVLPLKWLYKPGVPILRLLPALLYLFGLAALLARRRWSQVLLLGLWLAAFGFLGGLSDSTPAAQRYVAAVPALALLAGYGLATAADLAGRIGPPRPRLVLSLAAGVALFAAANDALFYFDHYTPKERYSDPNGLAVQRLAGYLQSKDAGTEVVFVGYTGMVYNSIPTLGFLNPQVTRVVDIHNPAELEAALQQPSPHRVYFFAMGHQADLQRVQQAHPGGRLTSEVNWYQEPVYWIYETGP